MKKFVTILLLFVSFVSNSQSADELFKEGNTFYKVEDYNRAMGVYLAIEEKGIESSDLYYNLGNCYYNPEFWPWLPDCLEAMDACNEITHCGTINVEECDNDRCGYECRRTSLPRLRWHVAAWCRLVCRQYHTRIIII